eukprot:TRINITY_DN20053_c0_g1_i1.p1 TRINITY_DN20053_c0_g1~~TRINITY_DN20053_c0_g1_i1.p1  ORF type:complete len:123 (+),score=38.70 TRINITY_DN20053_c0_g1_i1:64-432(+)
MCIRDRFYRSQNYKKGSPYQDKFRWWGPEENLNYGSGMDDFPRGEGQWVSSVNLDIQTWMVFWSKSMEVLAEELKLPLDRDFFRNRGEKILNNLFTLLDKNCLLYTSPSPRDRQKSRMPSSA